MLVSELIDELKEFNPNAEVCTPYSETIALGWIESFHGKKVDKKTTTIVFIEWADYECGDDKWDR